MPNITSVKLLKTHRSAGAEVAWTVEFLDNRKASPIIVRIGRDELRNPDRPTLLAIQTACIRRHNPPPTFRASRATVSATKSKWSKAHEVARDVALSYSVDIDRLVSAVDSAHAELLAEFEGSADRIAARRAAARHLEVAPHRLPQFVAKVDNGYKDRASIGRFDELCEQLADEFPGSGLVRDNPDSLWELLRETPAARPSRLGADTIRHAADIVATVATDEIDFAEWRDDAADSADDVAPF